MTAWISGFVVGIRENSNYAIAIGIIIGVLVIYYVVSRFIKRKKDKTGNKDVTKQKNEKSKKDSNKKDKSELIKKEELDKVLDEMEEKE